MVASSRTSAYPSSPMIGGRGIRSDAASALPAGGRGSPASTPVRDIDKVDVGGAMSGDDGSSPPPPAGGTAAGRAAARSSRDRSGASSLSSSSSAAAEAADRHLGLEDLPDSILLTVSHCLGPQSTLLGLGSSSSYLRSVCVQDGAWRFFYGLRCASSLSLGGRRPLAADRSRSRSGGGDRGGREDRLAAGSFGRREDRWAESFGSFEGGRQTPDETFLALYRRLHVAGTVQGLQASVTGIMTCNRSLGLGALGFSPDGGAAFAEHEPSLLRVCGSAAAVWCDDPSCSKARCRRCVASAGGDAAAGGGGCGGPAPIVRCDWCQIRLCRGCAASNLSWCDCCRRGACLDCASTLSTSVATGPVRTCCSSSLPSSSSSSSEASSCSRSTCWECAATVGKAGDGVNFEVRAFGSARRFRDSSPRQTYCRGCAERRVAKLNLYKRLEMSPR